ncbi:MAG: chromosomal replication initiator DnaA [Alphaproteobacteria bacterium]|nr:chromosomal replication initiator DnaA [Alphaproteobacteria bacterium]
MTLDGETGGGTDAGDTRDAGNSPEQLAFLFHFAPRFDRASFVTSHSNFEALTAIDQWPAWRHPALALYGPPACGKSHLAAMWAADARAETLDARRLAGLEPRHGAAYLLDLGVGAPPQEEALFHFLNRVDQGEASLLLAARVPPSRWPVELPDLATRLGAIPSVGVGTPDEGLMRAVLAKHLKDRQLALPAALVDFLVEQMGASLSGLAGLVEALEREVVRGRRIPSRARVVDLLVALGADEEGSLTDS